MKQIRQMILNRQIIILCPKIKLFPKVEHYAPFFNYFEFHSASQLLVNNDFDMQLESLGNEDQYDQLQIILSIPFLLQKLVSILEEVFNVRYEFDYQVFNSSSAKTDVVGSVLCILQNVAIDYLGSAILVYRFKLLPILREYLSKLIQPRLTNQLVNILISRYPEEFAPNFHLSMFPQNTRLALMHYLSLSNYIFEDIFLINSLTQQIINENCIQETETGVDSDFYILEIVQRIYNVNESFLNLFFKYFLKLEKFQVGKYRMHLFAAIHVILNNVYEHFRSGTEWDAEYSDDQFEYERVQKQRESVLKSLVRFDQQILKTIIEHIEFPRFQERALQILTLFININLLLNENTNEIVNELVFSGLHKMLLKTSGTSFDVARQLFLLTRYSDFAGKDERMCERMFCAEEENDL
ncbi:Hypothetical_protein [Hexamita inflata]|uniref:Hypothetical_protein n=1 Tax=Hexamita inflata TaxID=28002 RepID=A0AA86UM46_9EUKA|nr:Hypothetical protein HINF_LOCUS48464 [Hexamita inflata]